MSEPIQDDAVQRAQGLPPAANQSASLPKTEYNGRMVTPYVQDVPGIASVLIGLIMAVASYAIECFRGTDKTEGETHYLTGQEIDKLNQKYSAELTDDAVQKEAKYAASNKFIDDFANASLLRGLSEDSKDRAKKSIAEAYTDGAVQGLYAYLNRNEMGVENEEGHRLPLEVIQPRTESFNVLVAALEKGLARRFPGKTFSQREVRELANGALRRSDRNLAKSKPAVKTRDTNEVKSAIIAKANAALGIVSGESRGAVADAKRQEAQADHRADVAKELGDQSNWTTG